MNLRNAANLDSDVIGQVQYGDELEILELLPEWVRVRPPGHIPVWVHGGLLFEEREVRARVLNVRNGPGTQFTSFGQLQRGDPVRVLESADEWRRIEAPESVSLWVSREFVQLRETPPELVPEQAPEAVPEEMPAETAEIEPVPQETVDVPEGWKPDTVVEADPDPMVEVQPEDVAVEEQAPVQVLEAEPVEPGVDVDTAEDVDIVPPDLPLVPLPGQGTASMRRGWVKAYLLAGSSPSRFHLVYRQGSQEQTLAYLQGDEEQLRQLSGRSVQVRGRDFWVAGQRVPVMRVDSVEALESPNP